MLIKKWTDSQSQQTIPSQKENPSPKPKSESPPLHSDWLVTAGATARFSVCSYLPGLPQDKTSVHVNTGTHREQCRFITEDISGCALCAAHKLPQHMKMHPQIPYSSQKKQSFSICMHSAQRQTLWRRNEVIQQNRGNNEKTTKNNKQVIKDILRRSQLRTRTVYIKLKSGEIYLYLFLYSLPVSVSLLLV